MMRVVAVQRRMAWPERHNVASLAAIVRHPGGFACQRPKKRFGIGASL
jgi:hypothetical protein